jgi:protein ImuB
LGIKAFMSTSQKRVIAVWLPTFATDRLQRAGHDPDLPLATVGAVHGGLRVAAANGAARRAGVDPGSSVADARALAPGLRTVNATPAADARALESLAGWCGRYTPWTAVAGGGRHGFVDGDGGHGFVDGDGGHGVWLDVTGCAHLFGSEADLLGDLTERLGGLGLNVRAALADTPGGAWAVARFAAGDDAIVIPAGETRAALTPLPVAGLRLPRETAEGLQRVGLRRIGDLLPLPRAPLAARFGETLVRRLDQALGHQDEPVSPRLPVPALRVRLNFAEPIGLLDDVTRATRQLLEDLRGALERSHQGARRLDLALYRVDGTVARAAVGTSRPLRDADHLERLFKEKLDKLHAGFGIELIILSVTAVEDLPLAQTVLAAPDKTLGDDLPRLLDRLGNRLGANGVVRLSPRASHIPERACRPIPAAARSSHDDQAWPANPRPIHLLPWPEPIQAEASRPDRPPLAFLWRARHHRVARAEGPERIGPEWWRDERGHEPGRQDRVRDYYRVESAEGRRFWLYREGPYRPDTPGRWYLHGFFA